MRDAVGGWREWALLSSHKLSHVAWYSIPDEATLRRDAINRTLGGEEIYRGTADRFVAAHQNVGIDREHSLY
jgi:hypothetical protein